MLMPAIAMFVTGCAAHHVSPSQLFAGACNRYANAQSYEDVATIDTIFPSRVPVFATDVIEDHTVRARLRTAFRRPDSMRIDFDALPPDIHFVFTIWSHNNKIEDWTTIGEPTTFASLGDAMAAYGGVSSGGSEVVPRLLVGDDSLCRRASVTGEGGELGDVSGAPCRVVRLMARWGEHVTPFEVCIDSSYTIRQWRTWTTIDGRIVSTVATYQAQFDVDVPKAIFDFVPPHR
jgi:hypothetical protein